MARTSDEGARLPVRVRVQFGNGDVAYAPCREAPRLRFYGDPLQGRPGFVVDATGPVDAFTAECIAYALNEGPDDMESGDLDYEHYGLPALTWALEREGAPEHPPRTDELMPREFPDYPVADIPEFPEGFECAAWHNDTCPVFHEGTSAAEPAPAAIMVAVDYADPTAREFPDTSRFGFHIYEGGDFAAVHGSDDWREIRALIVYVRAVRSLAWGFHPDTPGREYVRHDNGERFYSEAQADELDAAVETVCGMTDPYELGFRVWRALGLPE
jgi:hypothetical protein